MNGERSFLSAQRTEPQLRHVYAIYVRLYLNRARIRQDYANYIFAKHKTDSAKSYSHYTRFYALIGRVCTPAKTSGFSSIKRNSQEVRAARFAAKPRKNKGTEGNNNQVPLHPQSGAHFAAKPRNSEGDKRPHQPRPSFSPTIRGRSRSRI